eukprot:gene5244-6525_t
MSKKKENPFSFFTYVKEEDSNSGQDINKQSASSPNTLSANLPATLPIFNDKPPTNKVSNGNIRKTTQKKQQPSTTTPKPPPTKLPTNSNTQNKKQTSIFEEDDIKSSLPLPIPPSSASSKPTPSSIVNNNNLSSSLENLGGLGNGKKTKEATKKKLHQLFNNDDQDFDEEQLELDRPRLSNVNHTASTPTINQVTPSFSPSNSTTPNLNNISHQPPQPSPLNLPLHNNNESINNNILPTTNTSTTINNTNNVLPSLPIHTLPPQNTVPITSIPPPPPPTAANEEIQKKLETLQNENLQYKAMIKKLQTKCKLQQTEKETLELKLQDANNKLEQFKIKEAKETKMMEDMVAQVEENLLSTKKRAQQAEAYAEQLKFELQNLKSAGSNTPEVQELRYRLQDAREKGRYVSQLFYQATTDADVNIKNLMRGIETLQNISGLLTAIDKISNIPS